MRVVLEKIPGVDWVDVSLAKASADINLKTENRVTMQQLRSVLKKSGYPTRDAEVEARGTVTNAFGEWTLDLLNGGTLPLVDDAKSRAAGEAPQPVSISGVSRAEGKDAERLTVTAIR